MPGFQSLQTDTIWSVLNLTENLHATTQKLEALELLMFADRDISSAKEGPVRQYGLEARHDTRCLQGCYAMEVT